VLQLQFELDTGEMAAQEMKNRLRSLTLQHLGCSMGCFAVADYEDLDRWGSHEGCIELPGVDYIVGAFVPFVAVETLRDGFGAVVVAAEHKKLLVAPGVWELVDWCFGAVMVWRS
jgi:hypothetical protein